MVPNAQKEPFVDWGANKGPWDHRVRFLLCTWGQLKIQKNSNIGC